MKKRLIAIIITVILSAAALLGCSGSIGTIRVSEEFKQNTDYIVYSNGGSAVQYGNIVYFINGTRGYEDTDGKQNLWATDKAVKGGLYKARLRGEKSGRDFAISINADTNLEFYSHAGVDYMDEETPIDIVDVELFVPKTIGTSGYSSGGIFIYDDFVYYATPNNLRDKTGAVQVNKTDFMRTKIDGSITQLIFTTTEDSANSAYNFYKQGDSVYLVAHYDTNLVSVRMRADKVRPDNPILITDKADTVLLPHKSVYDANNNITNSPEDFVYYTRAIEEDDKQVSGNVVEACRPDGSENFTFLMTGETVELKAVSGGGLFYTVTDGNNANKHVRFTNLHDQLYLHSPTYKAYEDSQAAVDKRFNVVEEFYSSKALTDYTYIHYMRSGYYSNEFSLLLIGSGGVQLVSTARDPINVLNKEVTFQFIQGNTLYYTFTDGTMIYKTDFTLSQSQKGDNAEIQVSAGNTISSGLKPDFVAGYVFYFSDVDELAGAYGTFKDQKREGVDPVHAYARIEADEKEEEDE